MVFHQSFVTNEPVNFIACVELCFYIMLWLRHYPIFYAMLYDLLTVWTIILSQESNTLTYLLTRARWLQSHTNNGFFKLVEAVLQIYSYFFSHSIKLYVAYRYQQCHCLAALPAKMSVFNSHMQGFHSAISNKPRLHSKKHIGAIKTQKTCVTNKNIRVCTF